LSFPSDDARCAHFTEELRKRLQDPEFRKIEGFPIGSDEDILALSDPPYYTACPNPWVADFVREWEDEKSTESDTVYHRIPFATDVRHGGEPVPVGNRWRSNTRNARLYAKEGYEMTSTAAESPDMRVQQIRSEGDYRLY
jgi:hypothetical protein